MKLETTPTLLADLLYLKCSQIVEPPSCLVNGKTEGPVVNAPVVSGNVGKRLHIAIAYLFPQTMSVSNTITSI